jgi:hypothetical protein
MVVRSTIQAIGPCERYEWRRRMDSVSAVGSAVYGERLNLCVWNKSNAGMGSRQGDRRHLSKPHGPGCLKPAMTRNDSALGVSEYRIGEAERLDGSSKLFDLALRMGAGVARIRNEITHRAVGEGESRRRSNRCWLIHNQEAAQKITDWRLGVRGTNGRPYPQGHRSTRCC